MTIPKVPEAFNAQRQSQIDCAEYQFRFQAAMCGDLNDTSQTLSWRHGWSTAQAWLLTATFVPAAHLKAG
jgi:hypothetical protein